MKRMKGAQADAVGISVFLLLLALFIILFTILLPEEERADLLGTETGSQSTTTTTPGIAKQVILSESPGKVHTYTQNLQTYSLDSLRLFSKESTETISIIKSLQVSRNILKDNYKTISFDLADPEGVKDLKLNFLITESKGKIFMKLNNKLVYEGELTSNQMPLNLPVAYLKNKNAIELAVSMPTTDLFSSNYYLIQDVALIKQAKVSNRKDTRILYLDPTFMIKGASLDYFVSCNSPTGEALRISLNNNKVLDDAIFCEYPDKRTITINQEYFNKDGKNTFEFEVTEGDYNIDQLSLKLELGKSGYPRYYFNIEPEVYEALTDKKASLFLEMKFKGTEAKKASVTVQDTEFYFDTTEQTYTRKIASYVDSGANYLLIMPKNNFEITSLKIVLK
ncbi:hypothetical protein HY643_04690 [Candidatus Woesearchaeota archaeon]|nr:hypothetical protein [Candidatus Woesearchaeota archaeon]